MKLHPLQNRFSSPLSSAAALGVLALAVCPAFALQADQARVVGPESESKQISVTVWLKPHNKPALDALLEELYDKTSPNYHHFLSLKQYNERFSPTEKEAASVRDYLGVRGMRVVSTDKHNRFIVAQGRVGDAQAAFNVKLNRMNVAGEFHHATAEKASIPGPVGELVATVQGLSDLRYKPNVKRTTDLDTGKPVRRALASGGAAFVKSANCLRAPESFLFKTNGSFPEAFYAGNRYGGRVNLTGAPPTPCGYDAADMQSAYGLKALYDRGLDGTGQTIVIVDAFGSNSIIEDTNLFSQLNGLPPLTTSNFAIVSPTGPATCTDANGCISGNWNLETSLDVQWAHAIAPKANIVLVLGADNSFANLDLANLYAIDNGLGSVISNSFGAPEVLLQVYDPSELVVESGISQIAAALGISQNISSGDNGDDLAEDTNDFGINATSVDANSASPYATGIGGTSTFLDSSRHIKLQTGWGLNFARIADPTPNPPTVPPLLFGFSGGSGGGVSRVVAKPKFQKQLKGKFRLVPDVAMNADPETGNEFIISPDGNPADGTEVGVVGGTSLACPMFSAFWAIANQAAGGGPIGAAAPILYALPSDAFIDVDVKPADTLQNVTGLIIDPPNSPVYESAASLAEPLENTKLFVSALYHSPYSFRWDVFTFGTDSSLATGPGWDNVTGLGTPNGAKFVDLVVAEVKK